MDFLAQAALAGIPPNLFLNTDNDMELEILTVIANKAIEEQGKHRHDLAERIIQRLSKALGKNN